MITRAAERPGAGWGSIVAHIGGCVIASVVLCACEDFDCQHLKPNVHLRPQAILGLAEGYKERRDDWRGGNILVSPSDISMINVRSYNEVMKKHRAERVPSWDKSINEADVQSAVGDIFAALSAVEKLKISADDYGWDDMRELIRTPVLSNNVARACSILRRASFALSTEARETIGFDWGSCAWRHCGAEADTQEALAELYNLLGVLEPFECKFILDVVERSLRDVLAVVPVNYYDQTLSTYRPYPVKDVELADTESSIDEQFLNALAEFRNPQWEDE